MQEEVRAGLWLHSALWWAVVALVRRALHGGEEESGEEEGGQEGNNGRGAWGAGPSRGRGHPKKAQTTGSYHFRRFNQVAGIAEQQRLGNAETYTIPTAVLAELSREDQEALQREGIQMAPNIAVEAAPSGRRLVWRFNLTVAANKSPSSKRTDISIRFRCDEPQTLSGIKEAFEKAKEVSVELRDFIQGQDEVPCIGTGVFWLQRGSRA